MSTTMPRYLTPSTWKRLANDDNGRLVYRARASSMFGWILVVLAGSGFYSTTSEMIRRWPDERSLFFGGLLFSIRILAVGLCLLVNQEVLIDKSKDHVLRTWRWLLWRGEKTDELTPYDSVSSMPDESPRSHNDIKRFSVSLTGSDGAKLTLIEHQSCEVARRLTQEVATLLRFHTADADDETGIGDS